MVSVKPIVHHRFRVENQFDEDSYLVAKVDDEAWHQLSTICAVHLPHHVRLAVRDQIWPVVTEVELEVIKITGMVGN